MIDAACNLHVDKPFLWGCPALCILSCQDALAYGFESITADLDMPATPRVYEWSARCFPLRYDRGVARLWMAEKRIALKYQQAIIFEKIGAGDANRTRDPNLGKVMLYP